MSETANAQVPGTNTVPDAALAFASAQQGRTTVRPALAFACAPPELQQDNDALLKILAKFESSVHLTKPGPNQANIEKWRMRNEMKLLENTSCPDAVRVWWRNIWLEADKRKLANHNGQSQFDGKLLK